MIAAVVGSRLRCNSTSALSRSPMADSVRDAALGALLGAFVGDAAGAVLEFQQRVTAEQVQNALAFPGGGAHGVGPGQVTDDSELALCLALGLQTAAPLGFPAVAVAGRYVDWVQGPPEPFDLGIATSTALLPGAAAKFRDAAAPEEVLQRVVAAAAKGNGESKANGALMRCTPLAVWGHRLPSEQLAAAARHDARLTHPNPACQDASAAYVIAVATLVRQPGNAAGAVNAAEAWAKAHACEEVQAWLGESKEAGGGPDCDKQIGFVRWAFVHAFRLLRRGTGFEGGLEAMLLRGGDTDTNAAIVGGLLGALWGAAGIPEAWRQAVLGFDSSSGGQRRPEWLAPVQLPALVDELLALASAADE